MRTPSIIETPLSGQILSEYEVTDESGSVSWNHKRDLLRGAEGAVAAVYNNGDERYFHTDHLGTPRVLTNGNGSVVGRHHYYPFGDEVDQGIFSDGFESGDLSAWAASGNSGSDDLSIKFTGHQRELHRTSDYMLGRHYFVKPGRFASVDPARDGWNLYSYAAGNPVAKIDPTGRVVLLAARGVDGHSSGSHAYVIIIPTGRNKTKYADRIRDDGTIQLSGGPGYIPGKGTRLVKYSDFVPLDTLENAREVHVVQPGDQTTEQYEQNVIEAYDSYENGSEYYQGLVPVLGTENSNSFTSGILTAAGADQDGECFMCPGDMPSNLQGLNPGWTDPIELPDATANDSSTVCSTGEHVC